MREYGQIQCSFWSDPDIQALNDQGKLLFAYLLTGPHSNGLGCYRLPSGYVSSDLGWSLETVSKAFRYLIDSLFLVRCERTDWIILPKFLSWNGIANPKVAAARIKEAREVPKQSIIWPVMVEALNQFARKHLPEDFVTMLDEEWRPIATRIPKTIKDLVWERDGGKCTECGSESDVTFDHRRPIIYGGQHTETNLRLLCRSCNSKWFPNRIETVSKQKPIQTITKPYPEPDPEPTREVAKRNASRDAKINGAETKPTWDAYDSAYMARYAVRPVRNAKVNSQIKILVQRLGVEEAPHVAGFFLTNNNAYYVSRGHSLDCLVKDAEKLRTEWATGRRVTSTRARQIDQTQTNADAFAPLLAEARERENGKH